LWDRSKIGNAEYARKIVDTRPQNRQHTPFIFNVGNFQLLIRLYVIKSANEGKKSCRDKAERRSSTADQQPAQHREHVMKTINFADDIPARRA
jgi:hypothetical protein